MKRFFEQILNKLQYWLLVLMALPFLFGSTFAARDLLDHLMEPTKNHETTIDIWDTEEEVWESVFHDWTDVVIGEWLGDDASVIAKFTRLFLVSPFLITHLSYIITFFCLKIKYFMLHFY